MPRSDGRSCFTTTAWWCFKPSASSVRRSNAGRPIPERTCRIRSSPLPGGGSGRSRPGFRLRYFRVGGSLAMGHFLARPVRDGLELDAALLGDAPRRREVLQPIQRGSHHVVRVGGAEALREDVAHTGALEHRAHRPAGDDAGSGRGGFQKHAPGAVVPDDFMRDGRARERDLARVAPLPTAPPAPAASTPATPPPSAAASTPAPTSTSSSTDTATT